MFKHNGVEVKKRYHNGVEVKKHYHNGVLVWEKWEEFPKVVDNKIMCNMTSNHMRDFIYENYPHSLKIIPADIKIEVTLTGLLTTSPISSVRTMSLPTYADSFHVFIDGQEHVYKQSGNYGLGIRFFDPVSQGYNPNYGVYILPEKDTEHIILVYKNFKYPGWYFYDNMFPDTKEASIVNPKLYWKR